MLGISGLWAQPRPVPVEIAIFLERNKVLVPVQIGPPPSSVMGCCNVFTWFSTTPGRGFGLNLS